MTDKEQKIKEIKEFIKLNPDLSGNETLKELRNKNLGIRKTDFFKLFREQRKLPEPTKEKKEKSIPKQFRKPPKRKPPKKVEKKIEQKEVPTKPKKSGQYGVIEVIDKEGNSFWIKYKNRKDFSEQLEKLKPSIQSDELMFVSHGFRKYISFIEKEFKQKLIAEGITS